MMYVFTYIDNSLTLATQPERHRCKRFVTPAFNTVMGGLLQTSILINYTWLRSYSFKRFVIQLPCFVCALCRDNLPNGRCAIFKQVFRGFKIHTLKPNNILFKYSILDGVKSFQYISVYNWRSSSPFFKI
jgi:hypothetical protein